MFHLLSRMMMLLKQLTGLPVAVLVLQDLPGHLPGSVAPARSRDCQCPRDGGLLLRRLRLGGGRHSPFLGLLRPPRLGRGRLLALGAFRRRVLASVAARRAGSLGRRRCRRERLMGGRMITRAAAVAIALDSRGRQTDWSLVGQHR